MLGFKEKQELELFEAQQYLEEKLIMFNNGKKYGQIVFMAGGAGSGKGFAQANFMESDKFKIRDVDAWKLAFLELAKVKEKHKELRGLDLRKGADVFKLHAYVAKFKIKSKTLDALLTDLKPDRLPNILFDITAKNVSDLTKVVPKLIEVGYDPKDIHLEWVLTNYHVAVKNNADRERVVPDDILLQTHEGAARTMWSLVKKGKLPSGMNGRFDIILNNRKNTILYVDSDGKPIEGTGTMRWDAKKKKMVGKVVVKDFTYMQLKKEGKPMAGEKAMQQQLHQWVSDNVPKTALTTKDMDI